MAKEPAVSDAALTKILTGYAALVRPVLDNPLRWLGADDEPGADASLPARAIDAVKDRTLGEPTRPRTAGRSTRCRTVSTGGSTGSGRSVDWPPPRPGSRARWPTGSRSRRALGASGAGIAVCAVAREDGKIHAADWVPLLARVLFNRDLAPQAAPVPPREESEHQLEDAAADTREPPSRMAELAKGHSVRSGPCGGWPGPSSTSTTCSTSVPGVACSPVRSPRCR